MDAEYPPNQERRSQVSQYLSPTEPPTLNATMVGNNGENEGGVPPITSPISSSQSTPMHLGVANAQALQPPFQPPSPGQLLVAQATRTMGGFRRSMPVLMYSSPNGDAKYVYPFTRTLVGTVWHTSEQMEQCDFQHIHEPDPIRFCSRRADLPAEMVQTLLHSLEHHGGGSRMDPTRLKVWHEDVRHPEGLVAAGVPCMLCGILNEVRLSDVMHLSGISNGMACHHLGKDCIKEDGSIMRAPRNSSNPSDSRSSAAGNTGLAQSHVQVRNHSNHMTRCSPLGSGDVHRERMHEEPRVRPFPQTVRPSQIGPPPGLRQLEYTPDNLSRQPSLVDGGQYTTMGANTPNTWRHVETLGVTPMPNNYLSPHHLQVPSNCPPTPYLPPEQPIYAPATSSWTNPNNTIWTPTPAQTFVPPHVPTKISSWNAAPANSTPVFPYKHNQPYATDTQRYIPSNTPNVGYHAPSQPLYDEVIQPGELLHSDTNSCINSTQWSGDASNMPHPSMLVRGRVLSSFTSAPPSLVERQELQAMKADNRLEKLNTVLSKKLSDRTVPTFKGESDNVQSYSQWEAALLKHFYSSNIHNSAVRAWLAQNTFAEAANVWWVSHQSRRPMLTLSWQQLRELIQSELVPSVERGSANAMWADLTYDGHLETFFTKVRTMSLYHPLPPKEIQIMASRPFGTIFVERVKGSVAQQGDRGLTIPQWESMVRAYVAEQEAHPHFHAWGRGGLEPLHRPPHKLRHAHFNEEHLDEPELLNDIPGGMDEEEWTSHVSCLFSTFGTKPQGGIPLKIGKGVRPCFVCGQDGHSWVKCERRKKGKCGVCGSENHYTRFCFQRYYPDPKLAAAQSTSAPAVRATVVTSPVNEEMPVSKNENGNHSIACNVSHANNTQEGVLGHPNQGEKPNDTTCNSPVTNTTRESSRSFPSCSLSQDQGIDNTSSAVHEWPSIRQVSLASAGDLALPEWLKSRLNDSRPRTRVGQSVIPKENPNLTGQLHFTVSLEGSSATMLYDPGASHCFLDWEWAHKNHIKMKPRPSSSLNMFQGTALGAIRWSYIANDFVLGDASYVWRFLVIKPAPADIVLGLDFILHHKPIFDPLTLRLQPTAPLPSEETGRKFEEELHEPHQDNLEKHWVASHDVVQPRHLNFASMMDVDAHALYGNSEHSTTLFSVTANTMEEEQQLQQFYQTLDTELLTVVQRFDMVFAPPDKEPPERTVKHDIKLTKDACPIKRRPYPLPPHKLDAMHVQIRELETNGWIEPSSSPWGAPILFVPKKNGEWRMCVDFRDLNSVTIDDCFPLPRIEVMLHRASRATVFSKLDLASGFHQIAVESDARPLTAFRLPEPVNGSSLWQWKVMPFGLRNAPPTFQRAMTQALNGLEHCAVVYIDDILIFSRDKSEHLKHLHQVFEALRQNRYHVRLPKCEFLRHEVEFLGHRLSSEGIAMQEEKVTALQGWKTPFVNSKQVKSFLGATAWYQNFIAHYATLAAPLYDLTSTRKKFQWNEQCEQAVMSLKRALTKAPVLARWQQERNTRVITDASKVGVGAVLEQFHDQGWRPISFWSRKLRGAELNYSATDLEWLAVVLSITRIWHWLLDGKPFTICSDHKALERKLHKSAHDPPISDRQARWIESLIRFPYTFEWVKGANNTLADALSRNPDPSCNATVSVTHSLLAGLRKRLRLAAEQDEEYLGVIEQARDPATDLKVFQGLIWDAQGRVHIPRDAEIRTLLISEAHDSPMAGHFGIERTLEIVQRRWHWRGIQRDVREYVKTCAICQRAKHANTKSAGELHPIVASRPWEIITLDFVSGLPKDPHTKAEQILVIVDKFTKYVMLEPCSIDIDAIQTASIFTKRVIGEHGIPSVVISDRGPQFAAAVWAAILKNMGSRVALASTHHPQTDGQSERVIQTLSRIIRAYVRDQSHAWVQLLPLFQFALNNSSSSATRMSPFQLIQGRDPVAPTNLFIDQPDDCPGGIELGNNRKAIAWARNWWKARRKLCKFAAENLKKSAAFMKRRYDSGRKPLNMEPGDLVLLSIKSHPTFGEARKLRLRYTGPYVIRRKVHANAYELEGLPPSVPATQNVSHLRLFFPTPPKFETRPQPATAVGPLQVKDHLEWEVDSIVQDRIVAGQRQYLIRWKDHEEKTWVRVTQLQHCAELLREYQYEKGIALDFWSETSSSPETLSEEGTNSPREGSEGEATSQAPRCEEAREGEFLWQEPEDALDQNVEDQQ